jgi:hypothetical protein
MERQTSYAYIKLVGEWALKKDKMTDEMAN